MRLTTAIITGFAISPLLAAALVAGGLKGVTVLSHSHSQAATSAATAAEVSGFSQDGDRLYRVLADTVISRDLGLADKPWNELKATISGHLDRIDARVSDATGKAEAASESKDSVEDTDGKAMAVAARKNFDEFVAIYEKEIVMMVKIDAEASDLRPIAQKLAEIRDAFMDSLKKIAEAHAQESAAEAAAYTASEVKLIRSAWIAAACVMALNLLLASLIVRKARFELTVKVGKVLNATASAEDGDLTVQTGLTGADVSDRVGQALERFLGTLRTNVSTIASTSSRIGKTSAALVTTGETLDTSASITAQQSAGAATAAAQVSENSQTVSAALEEMGASIAEISRSAQEAAGVAREALNSANQALSLAENLDQSSNEIGTVTKAIDTIAQKTNLLALNATIEAASAGEAGRGFAVVAGEVKDLARQTQKATADIDRSIQTLRADSRKVAEVIRVITKVSQQIETLQGSIAAAVEQQNATTQDATRSMNEVSRGFSEITVSITAVADAAKNTSASVVAVRAAASDMNLAASELQSSIGTYRI
jgi:methyl-accepting chemotaxis protein